MATLGENVLRKSSKKRVQHSLNMLTRSILGPGNLHCMLRTEESEEHTG